MMQVIEEESPNYGPIHSECILAYDRYHKSQRQKPLKDQDRVRLPLPQSCLEYRKDQEPARKHHDSNV